MAAAINQPPISGSAPPHSIPRFSNSTKPHFTLPLSKPNILLWFRPIYSARVAEQSSGLVGDGVDYEYRTVDQIKHEIYHIIKDVNRGIFGIPYAKKSYIEGLEKLLESQNPTPDPTSNLVSFFGDFSVGLTGKAINTIKFNVKGLNLFNGQLSIEASFKIASESESWYKLRTLDNHS